jgi:hypothetical protein
MKALLSDIFMRKHLLFFAIVLFYTTEIKAQLYGTPIVTWDFANGIPTDWIIGINSTTDLAQWEYRGPNTIPSTNVGARGSCSAISSPITSVTQSNGFVIFDSNYWDDQGPQCGAGFGTGPDPAPHTAWLITNPVDMSSMQGAVLTFQQQYRHFSATTKVQISVDGGNVWTDLIENTSVQSPNSEWKSVNITDIVTGQTNVQFKFLFQGTYYWWLLDDISVFQPSANDLMITKVRYTNGEGIDSPEPLRDMEYDQYPLSMIPPFRFKTKVMNVGINQQTGTFFNATITKDGTTEVYNENSPPVNVNPSVTQTLLIQDDFQLPAELGEYKVNYVVQQDQTDATPNNRLA